MLAPRLGDIVWTVWRTWTKFLNAKWCDGKGIEYVLCIDGSVCLDVVQMACVEGYIYIWLLTKSFGLEKVFGMNTIRRQAVNYEIVAGSSETLVVCNAIRNETAKFEEFKKRLEQYWCFQRFILCEPFPLADLLSAESIFWLEYCGRRALRRPHIFVFIYFRCNDDNIYYHLGYAICICVCVAFQLLLLVIQSHGMTGEE